MRRSEALAPLSRDHHHALIVARSLMHADDADAHAAARAFVEFLTDHELEHFAVEEAVLLPAAEASQEGVRLGARMAAEHAQLRADLNRLGSGSSLHGPSELREIGRRLRGHVMFEERQFFPYLEGALSAEALAGLGARIAEQTGR